MLTLYLTAKNISLREYPLLKCLVISLLGKCVDYVISRKWEDIAGIIAQSVLEHLDFVCIHVSKNSMNYLRHNNELDVVLEINIFISLYMLKNRNCAIKFCSNNIFLYFKTERIFQFHLNIKVFLRNSTVWEIYRSVERHIRT